MADVSLKTETSYLVYKYTGYSNGIRNQLDVVVKTILLEVDL